MKDRENGSIVVADRWRLIAAYGMMSSIGGIIIVWLIPAVWVKPFVIPLLLNLVCSVRFQWLRLYFGPDEVRAVNLFTSHSLRASEISGWQWGEERFSIAATGLAGHPMNEVPFYLVLSSGERIRVRVLDTVGKNDRPVGTLNARDVVARMQLERR